MRAEINKIDRKDNKTMSWLLEKIKLTNVQLDLPRK